MYYTPTGLCLYYIPLVSLSYTRAYTYTSKVIHYSYIPSTILYVLYTLYYTLIYTFTYIVFIAFVLCTVYDSLI